MSADEITAQDGDMSHGGSAPSTDQMPADWLPEGMAAPSASAVARAEEAREQLKARGLDAWVEKKWWGFQVHMNKETAEQVVEVEELIADIVDAAIPKLGKVIAFCLKLHALAITAANTGEWG